MSNDTETTSPQGWRPEADEVLTGTVVSLDKGWSDYKGAFYPIVTLKQEDGTVTNVHCFHAVLERRMIALSPAIGDKLRITYHGKAKTKDGKREVSNYTVESNRKQDAAGFWGSLSGVPSSAKKSRPPEVPIDASDFTQGELEAEDEDIPF